MFNFTVNPSPSRPIFTAGGGENPGGGGGNITHGADITENDVGPAAVGFSSLTTLNDPGRGYFRGDTPLEFSDSQLTEDTDYDGYVIPSGTYIVEGKDFNSLDFYMTGSNSFLFRGCRGRSASNSVGFWNCAAGFTGNIYIFFCDLGSTDDQTYHEIPIKIANGSSAIVYRNRISYCTTGVQINIHNGEITENYMTDLIAFGTEAHVNGTTANGGERNQLILRNKILNPSVQTDCISFFQDFGTFPGDLTNRDGSTGYLVKDNYVGGGQYPLYAGKNAGSAADSVNNMVMTGNQITTTYYSTGGASGVVAAVPVWGTLGNSKSNNTWADGANQGQEAF